MTKTRKRWLLAGLVLLLLAGLIGGCTPAEPATTSRPTVTKAPATTTGTTEKTATTSTTAAPAQVLTAAQQKAIQDYLNAEENNGFIGSLNLYAAPQEASLWAIFYDGAGVGSWDMDAWSEEEKQALLTAAGWEEFYVKVIRIPAADAAKVVQEKLGIPLSAMSAPLDYHYLEAYDAYYHMHSDTNLQTVTVTGGTVSGDLYTVYYTAGFENETFTVVLRKTATGYQFVSNKKGKKD